MKTKFSVLTIFSLVVILATYFQMRSHVKLNSPAPIRTSKAYAALDRWSDQRAYPGKDIPDRGYYTAYEYSKTHLKSPLDSLSVRPWQPIGPHNIGGRTLTIAFNPLNPNTIYAGTASGGLWRSYSAGVGVDAWEYVPTGFPVLGVSSIAIVPEDSNTIYIGTGEVYNYESTGTGYTIRPTRGSYGIGILKSKDGGRTWAKSLDWSSNQRWGVWAIRINPENPNTIWAGTTEGTYKSLDAGKSWHQVNSTIMIMDLALHPTDTNTVIIAAGNLFSTGHGIYRTTDGGETWTKRTLGLPPLFGGKVMLAVSPYSPDIIFASIGNSTSSQNARTWLCRSNDSGDTWQVMSTSDYSKWQGWFSHDVAVHPNNSNIVIAAGVEIWKSTSGGRALLQISDGGIPRGRPPIGGPEGFPSYAHADIHDIVFHPTNPDTVYFATDGGVFRSTDVGDSYEGCNGRFQTTQFYQGISSSHQDSMLVAGGMQDNGTAIYDGQLAWWRVYGGDGGFTAINSHNDNIMYVSYQYLRLAKSVNQGISWARIDPPNTGGTPFIAPYIIGIDNPNVIYAGRSVVFKSRNAGNSWSITNDGRVLDSNPLLAFAISYQNSNVVYATTAPINLRAGIFRTKNGGSSWENITGSLPDRFPVDMAVDPTNDNRVYVVFSGFGTSHVFKSLDAGTSWQDIGQTLPDVPTSAVVIDPKYPDHIYVGNDIGVYASLDGGTTWQEFLVGLPDAVIVMDLIISPANRKLRVATHGNGFYERDLLDKQTTYVSSENLSELDFRLAQNYPNPFNPSTTIEYTLQKASRVELSIYNVLGEEVRSFVSQNQPAGDHLIIWDGKNDSGQIVSSGLYVYRLEVGSLTQIRKMILMR